MRNSVLGLTALAVTLAGAQAARADPLAQPAQLAPATEGQKSEDTAQLLSLGGSLAGPALIVTALENSDSGSLLHDQAVPLFVAGSIVTVFGPSAGTLYAGKPLTPGLGVRIAGATGVAVGASMFIGGLFASDTQALFGLGIGAASLGAIGVGMLMDIRDARNQVADYNRAHRARRDWTLAPTVSHANGAQQTGLAVVGSF